MPLFLTDVDNCILDWSVGFKNFLTSEHPEVVVDTTNYKLGLEHELMNELVNEFNSSQHFAQLESYGGAEIWLDKLANDFGFEFVAISTCMGTDPKTADLRRQGIERVFGEKLFKEFICLPLGVSKIEALSKFAPTYWVDDKLEHSIDGSILGHKSFNMVQPYNINQEKPKTIVPVNNWKDIYNYISKDL